MTHLWHHTVVLPFLVSSVLWVTSLLLPVSSVWSLIVLQIRACLCFVHVTAVGAVRQRPNQFWFAIVFDLLFPLGSILSIQGLVQCLQSFSLRFLVPPLVPSSSGRRAKCPSPLTFSRSLWPCLGWRFVLVTATADKSVVKLHLCKPLGKATSCTSTA